MTVWYSDHFGADGDNDTSLASPATIVSAGISGSRLRYKRATITGLPLVTTPDVLRFFTLKSGARLVDLLISSDGGSGAGAIDVGLYLSGQNHDGAVVDADLFASAQAISTAIHKTRIITESAVLQHEDTGKTLWEMVNVGTASTYASDPLVNFDICGTVTTSFTTTDSILTLEAFYTDGT